MNRQNLIDAIAEETESSKAAAARFMDSFIALVQQGVKDGKRVKISGFGIFEGVQTAARTGRNPQTGLSIGIAAQRRPKFIASESFRDLVKGSEQ